MACFTRVTAVPADLPNYLFEADLEASIVVPQSYTVVPTKDGQVQLNWYKSGDTTDDGFLWTEVYRSLDLITWNLIWVLDYPTTTYYDSDVTTNQIYYYKIRFVRLDAEGVIINTSNYTVPLAAKTVTALGFEPRDTYSNKFFKYLLQGLPGTRIYDRTDAALYSSNVEQQWQTTSKMVDGFTVKANGSVVDQQAADASALYSKRNVSFFLTNRYSKLLGVEESTGVEGEQIEVHSYLIHTFLMGYANQFLLLHEKYKQIVANKFIDFSQAYTKGFKPVVSSEKSPALADLYKSFGSLLGINPLRASSNSQGIVKYKNALKSSFTNVDRLGKINAINQACADILGITTQTVFEYAKYPWFNADRTFKLFTVPTASSNYYGYAISDGVNNDLKVTLLDERFNFFVEYVSDVYASPWVDVFGSSQENPYNYVAAVHISLGVTTAAEVSTRLNADVSIGHLINVTNSGGDTGAGTVSSLNRFRLTRHTPWVAWEDALFKIHGKTYWLKDIIASLSTGTDLMSFSRILDNNDRNKNIPAGYDLSGSGLYKLVGSDWVLQAGNALGTGELIALRDDDDAGASYTYESGVDTYEARFTGDKHIIFKMALTSENMVWLKSAVLELFVTQITQPGTLRLYRMKKQYDGNDVCWNYRKAESIAGYNWNGTEFVANTRQWVTEYWEDEGALGNDDRVLLKEFTVPKMTRPQLMKLDITDVLQQIYKYESARLNMGDDPQSILKCGFMLTMEGMPNKSIMIIDSETGTTPPVIRWTKMTTGYYTPPDGLEYFYVDGTSRYGRLLVLQSDREPVNYVKTVNERIRNADIKTTDGATLTVAGGVPASYSVGDKIYGLTSMAIGTITAMGGNEIYLSEDINIFQTETIRLLDDPDSATTVISSINRSGAKYVRISRPRYNGSILQVSYTGVATTPSAYPLDYPAYTVWSEEGAGIEPVFLSSIPSGTRLYYSEFDDTEYDLVHLNTTETLAALGDIIVTYQYYYEFLPLGRTQANALEVLDIEGCQRPNQHLFGMSDSEKYHVELMLPRPSTGEYVDISGLAADISGPAMINEYSDYNLGVLCDAISNIRRFDGAIDVFKYAPVEKPYRFNQLYHQFFRRV